MGRELRRKQAKREGKNVREVQKKRVEKPITPKSFVVIMVLLLLFFVVLYILTGLFVTKDIKWFGKNDNEETITDMQNKILAVDTLKQTEEEYYVYYYDTKEENSDVANALYSITQKVYRVDLNDGFNTNYVGEPSGAVDNIESLKVSNPTLVKVSFGKIVAYHSGSEEITSALK